MAEVTTARVLARKALQKSCGQECVDWAVAMLAAGHDAPHLAMLASEVPPYNHFELADLRDRALVEVGAPDISAAAAVAVYAAELFRLVLRGEADLFETLRDVKDLSLAHDHPGALWDFYLLFHAHDTLRDSEVQFYWDGATRRNIEAIVRRRAEELVARLPV